MTVYTRLNHNVEVITDLVLIRRLIALCRSRFQA